MSGVHKADHGPLKACWKDDKMSEARPQSMLMCSHNLEICYRKQNKTPPQQKPVNPSKGFILVLCVILNTKALHKSVLI